MTQHGFYENIDKVKYLTRRLSFKVPEITELYKIEYITFETTREQEIQRTGIDVIVKGFSFDPKILFNLQDYDKCFLIETISVIEKNVLGWVYTSQCDYIILCWALNSKHFMPVAYVLPLKEFRKTKLFKEFKDHIKWRRETSSEIWTTEFYMIPLNEFPEGFLIKFNPEEPPKNPPKTMSDWG